MHFVESRYVLCAKMSAGKLHQIVLMDDPTISSSTVEHALHAKTTWEEFGRIMGLGWSIPTRRRFWIYIKFLDVQSRCRVKSWGEVLGCCVGSFGKHTKQAPSCLCSCHNIPLPKRLMTSLALPGRDSCTVGKANYRYCVGFMPSTCPSGSQSEGCVSHHKA